MAAPKQWDVEAARAPACDAVEGQSATLSWAQLFVKVKDVKGNQRVILNVRRFACSRRRRSRPPRRPLPLALLPWPSLVPLELYHPT
jgi:hypothetical protein